jgi:hypothetical protein
MAYVPGFDWDIFISYPHELNAPDGRDLGWVKEFCRFFENEITTRLAGPDRPKVYFDLRNFGAADRLQGDLLKAARKSALFLPIMSPLYVAEGKFTLRELDAFCESGNFKNRIVTIDLLPVSNEEGRPIALRDLKRNDFYTIEENAPIKFDPRSEYANQYARRLQIVAEQTKDLLQRMRKERGEQVKIVKGPFSGKTALLAERQDEVEEQWDDIYAYLRDFGVNVLTADTQGQSDDLEASAAFNSCLEKADLFIQLLSPVDEANLAADGKPSRARLEYNLAVGRSPTIEILQWRKPNVRRNALTYWDKDLLDSPHVVVVELEEFEGEIKNKLSPPPPRQLPVRTSNKPYIYITADEEDIAYAQVIKQKAEGEKLAGNCEIIAPKDRMKNFEEAIIISDIIVFLYGQGKAEFVDGWLKTYENRKASGAAKPAELDALCRAPPHKPPREMLRGPLGSFQSFGSEDKFSADVIREILEEFQRRKAHTGVAAA